MAFQAEDVITIENFDSKISKANPKLSGLHALIDIGSNGIRFSISDLSKPRSRLLPCVYRERRGISLYDALHESLPGSRAFHFSDVTIAAVAQTLARFKYIIDQFQVPAEQVLVFATEAMRTAENKRDMFAAIKAASGLKVEILSPAMESLLGAMGARSQYGQVDGVMSDLGGSSVELAYLNSVEADYALKAAKGAQSMAYGAAKVTDALRGKSQSLSTKQELRAIIKTTFDGLQEQSPHLKKQVASEDGVTCYLLGGGYKRYASFLMHSDEIQPYPVPDVSGYTVSGKRFSQTQAMLKINEEEEGKIFGVSKRGRHQLDAIAMVVDALNYAIPNIKQVIFCSAGNREGILFMKLPISTQEIDPLRMYPGGAEQWSEDSVEEILKVVSEGLPQTAHSIFTPEMRRHVARNTWEGLGETNDANSAKSLHSTISGMFAGLPGMTHEVRAILALTMCARWGTELAPIDKTLYNNLRRLVGPSKSFLSEYFGTLMRVMATIFPTFPTDSNILQKSIV
jgi:retrograde regulation protein 2